ncbi:MAG: hypothetical protein ACE141_10110, partial [Bryobacteraceae bacterium]
MSFDITLRSFATRSEPSIGVSARALNLPARLAAFGILLAGLYLFVLANFPSWSIALVLLAALVAAVIPSVVRTNMPVRLATFFALLALCDFMKRVTFVAPDQAVWSQYTTFLFPYAYFGTLILVPYALDQYQRRVSWLGVLTLLYLGVALGNTWFAMNYGLLSKLAASSLLVLPWTMLLVGAAYGDSLHRVAWVLVTCGLVSTVYGLVQFVTGPTAIDYRWAEAAGGFSIGAGRLASALSGSSADG